MTLQLPDRGSSVYPAGVELFRQDQILEEIFLVVSGMIKLTQVNSHGRESLVGFATASDWPGAAAVIADQPSPTGAVTCSKTVLQQFPVETFRRLLHEDQQLRALVHEAHARELCHQSKWIGQLCSSDSRERLLSVLTRFARSEATVARRTNIRIQLPIRHWEVAELIGVTPEHLSRLLREIEDSGAIRRDKGWIFVADLTRLSDGK